MAKNKVVLAYSGGLDTSIMSRWLIENYDAEVIAMCADLGQMEELDGLEEKALSSGASKCYIEDLKEEFITDYIYPTLKAGAIYEQKYLLGTSFGRPLIAKKQVEIAQKEGANMVAHGATGKGNDQVRFELAFMALDPTLQIIAPWKDSKWDLNSREACEDYAKQHGIPVGNKKRKLYSEDRNVWHISHEGLELESTTEEARSDVYSISKTLEDAQAAPEYVELSFEQGTLNAVNGNSGSAYAMLSLLNKIGAEHGIGQIDIVENRLVGIKSRGVYETPGGSILYEGLRTLESLVLDRDSAHYKQQIALKYAELVYDGKWFSTLRESLDGFVNKIHEKVSGKVRLKLYKGNIVFAGATSPHSLYLEDLASFTNNELYNQQDASGFIRLFGLPGKVRGLVERKNNE